MFCADVNHTLVCHILSTLVLLEGGILSSATRGRTFLTHPNPSSFMLVIVQKKYDFRSL